MKDSEKIPIIEFMEGLINRAELVEDYETCAEIQISLNKFKSGDDEVYIAFYICKNFGECVAASINKKGQMFLAYTLMEEERFVFEVIEVEEYEREKLKIRK